MSLEDDLSCPVCTEVFREPVLLSCGHSFCRQCIGDYWTASGSRSCPVCRQVSPQQPLSNLGLRNACESYLKERRSEKKPDEELMCHIHGEKVQLFCQTDELPICSECKRHNHRYHKTKTLQQTARQRKGKIKAALHPVEKTLSSLQNGTPQDAEDFKYIQSQTRQTEQKIKEEFKKLYQFLKKEEESRIVALNKEEKSKKGRIERSIKETIQSLSDTIREVEEELKDDDITILQNYNSIMNRIEHTPVYPVLCSETLIDVPKHLGNLKYKVWEKMKDICPYYPVTLNPNTVPACFSVSDDLSSVTSHTQQHDGLIPLVLGNEGYGDGIHTFTVDVGNSRHWTLGVCPKPLAFINNVCGLRRDGDVYHLMSTQFMFQMKTHPKVVRVKIEDDYDLWGKSWRKISFFDDKTDRCFAKFTKVPLGRKLFPVLIPGDNACLLRVVPADVRLTTKQVEQKLSFHQTHRVLLYIGFCLCLFCCLFCYGYFGDSDMWQK